MPIHRPKEIGIDPLARELQGYSELGMAADALQLSRRILTQDHITAELFRAAVDAVLTHADGLKPWKNVVEPAYRRLSVNAKRKARFLMLSFNRGLGNFQVAVDFFDRYAQRNKDSNEALRLVTPFVVKFEIELRALKEKERIWETTVAPHFNVFRVLRIERKEQKLHSRFIAALQPSDLGSDLRWKEHLNMKERDLDRAFAGLIEDSCFNFDACPKSLADESQGLSYRIETYHEYFGFGLGWRKEACELNALCGLASVQNLSNRLKQYKCNGLELEPEPNKWWFCWAYWEKDIYDGSPWSWFSEERDPAWFEAKAKSFWDFVGQTHELVAAANDELKRH